MLVLFAELGSLVVEVTEAVSLMGLVVTVAGTATTTT